MIPGYSWVLVEPEKTAAGTASTGQPIVQASLVKKHRNFVLLLIFQFICMDVLIVCIRASFGHAIVVNDGR
jgi:hypothetical protein